MRGRILGSAVALWMSTTLAVAQPVLTPPVVEPGASPPVVSAPAPAADAVSEPSTSGPVVVSTESCPASHATQCVWPRPAGRCPAPTPIDPSLLPHPAHHPLGKEPTAWWQAFWDDDRWQTSGEFWFSGEYLLWWIRDPSIPPLVTSAPPGASGAVGEPGVDILFGGSEVEHDAFSGGRFTFGVWLNYCRTVGVQGDYFFLPEQSIDFASGLANLSRPFFNVVTLQPDARPVTVPGFREGSVVARVASSFQGAGGDVLITLRRDGPYQLDLLAGFRGVELAEELSVTESTGAFDHFSTTNLFLGGEVAVRGEYRFGPWFANGMVKLMLGWNEQEVEIIGVTAITPRFGPAFLTPGGLLALPSNRGHSERDEFAILPELSFNVGYQHGECFRVFAGYTFIYWPDVVRPGDQVDFGLNPGQIPIGPPPVPAGGPARPAFAFRETDLWAQGLSFGLEIRY